jgi:hypothetical protein
MSATVYHVPAECNASTFFDLPSWHLKAAGTRMSSTSTTVDNVKSGDDSAIFWLLKVTWYSVALGLALEIAVLLVQVFSSSLPKLPVIAADSVQKVSWSLLVCAALAIGVTSAKAVRTALSGVLGLFAAPLAFVIAKALHKAVGQALGAPAPPTLSAIPSPLVLAAIKAAEFAVLGTTAAWLSKQPWSRMKNYVLTGLAVALVFGGALIAYIYSSTQPHPAAVKLVPQALSELLYPMGCAMVLYGTDTLGHRLASTRSAA